MLHNLCMASGDMFVTESGTNTSILEQAEKWELVGMNPILLIWNTLQYGLPKWLQSSTKGGHLKCGNQKWFLWPEWWCIDSNKCSCYQQQFLLSMGTSLAVKYRTFALLAELTGLWSDFLVVAISGWKTTPSSGKFNQIYQLAIRNMFTLQMFITWCNL